MIWIKNVILLNKPLSNFEREEAARRLKIPSFRGVFLLDTLLREPNKKECGIVNFDKSGGPGTHLVGWYKNSKTKIYFDSYGVQPPKEVVDTWEDQYVIIPINFNQRGKYSAALCLYVLKELGAGHKFQKVLNKLFS